MADTHSKAVRSYNMSRIRGTNTKPEIQVRKYLFANGLRYRLHSKKLPGKPDVTLTKYQTVIFINGCFWHGHKRCRHFVMPKTNKKYWKDKIENNISRDRKNKFKLRKLGYKVYTIWECQIKKYGTKRLEIMVREIKKGK